jgi:hypothetical protein
MQHDTVGMGRGEGGDWSIFWDGCQAQPSAWWRVCLQGLQRSTQLVCPSALLDWRMPTQVDGC